MRFGNTTLRTTSTNEGGTAYKLSNKQELVKLALTSFIESSFYEKSDDKVKRLQDYINTISDAEFLLKLAIFGRDYGLRTVNHIIFTEAVLKLRGVKGARTLLAGAIDNFVKRPDELIEIISYYLYKTNQSPSSFVLPNTLKEIVREVLSKFDAYQLGKYKGKGKQGGVNLFDIINITHPKRTDSIDKLMKGTLPTPKTWETELSEKGNNKKTWENLMNNDELGAVAAIRNIRNMLKAGVSDKEIANYLDKMNWKKVFPFQAIQALDVLAQEHLLDDDSNTIVKAVMKNVIVSFSNISENYEGSVAIGIDVSGSMFGTKVSKLSVLDRSKLGLYYGLLLKEAFGERASLYFWSSDCKGPIDTNKTVNELYRMARSMSMGTSVTSLTNAVKQLREKADYVIILTDEEITDRLTNVANKGTIVWGLHDGKNSIVEDKQEKITKFYGYNDIMWKLGADLGQLSKIVEKIEKVSLEKQDRTNYKKNGNKKQEIKSSVNFVKKTFDLSEKVLLNQETVHSFSSSLEELEFQLKSGRLKATIPLFKDIFFKEVNKLGITPAEKNLLSNYLSEFSITYIPGARNVRNYEFKISVPTRDGFPLVDLEKGIQVKKDKKVLYFDGEKFVDSISNRNIKVGIGEVELNKNIVSRNSFHTLYSKTKEELMSNALGITDLLEKVSLMLIVKYPKYFAKGNEDVLNSLDFPF